MSVEPKAKRTHARRSCELCKIRKTRCELPDLEIISSAEAQPAAKACHRCKVLSLPCVVNDQGRRQSKKGVKPRVPINNEYDEGGDVSTFNSPSNIASSSSAKKRKVQEPVQDQDEGIDHSLRILHGMDPSIDWNEIYNKNQRNRDEIGLYSYDPFLRTPPNGLNGDNEDSDFGSGAEMMKLHGRPLEMTSAMMRLAYARSDIQDGKQEVRYQQPDWEKFVPKEMRDLIETRSYNQLRMLHPYLESFNDFFSTMSKSPLPAAQLLLSVVIYTCSLILAPSEAITTLRATLRSDISYLRDRVLLHCTPSFIALQALEMLCVHAPFGAMALQLTNLRALRVARGQLVALQSISSALGFQNLIMGLAKVNNFHPLWSGPDAFLYLSITATELSMALEDEVPRLPNSAKDSLPIANRFLDVEQEFLWKGSLETLPIEELIGRLGVCDRIARSTEIMESLERLKKCLESAVNDHSLTPTDMIVEELKYFGERMDRCDARHDAIFNILLPRTLFAGGYQTYRSMKRKFEQIKILGTALRYMLATRYLPGTPYALPSLPHDIPPHRRVGYAIARASNPADIIQVIIQHSAVTMYLWQYGNLRGEYSRQILNQIGDFSETIITPIVAAYRAENPAFASNIPGLGSASGSRPNEKPGELIPYHELVCIAIEVAKILMEMRAGVIVINKSTGVIPEAAKSPVWLPALAKACKTLRQFGTTALNYSTGEDQKGPGQVETVGNGASNILGSMVRMADKWCKMFGVDSSEIVSPIKKEEGRKGSGGLKGIQDLLIDSSNNEALNGSSQGDGEDTTTLNALEALANHDHAVIHDGTSLWAQPAPSLPPHQSPNHLEGHPSYNSGYPHPNNGHPDLNTMMNTPPYNSHQPSHDPNNQGQNQSYMPSERWMIDHNNTPGSGTSQSGTGPSQGNGDWNTYQPTSTPAQDNTNVYGAQYNTGHVQNLAQHGDYGQYGNVGQHHHQAQSQQQTHQETGSSVQPTALDMLLSQMFNYGPPPAAVPNAH